MPNWCSNTLKVRGSEDEVQKFCNKAKGKDTELSFNSLFPMPKELAITSPPQTEQEKKQAAINTAKYGAPTWYEWCVKSWGTKWDVSEVCLENEGDYLEYSFDTAWSPPLLWLTKVSEDFPELEFVMRYSEEGAGYFGVAKAVKGKLDDRCLDEP